MPDNNPTQTVITTDATVHNRQPTRHALWITKVSTGQRGTADLTGSHRSAAKKLNVKTGRVDSPGDPTSAQPARRRARRAANSSPTGSDPDAATGSTGPLVAGSAGRCDNEPWISLNAPPIAIPNTP